MADTVETKKYLIDFENNLKEYIDQLVKAKKALEDEQIAQANNTKGKFQSREQTVLNQAKIRDLQTEVKNNTKLVDLATLANKAQSGSYEQLYRQHQLLQTALKLEGGLMIQNTDGTYKMTDKYIRLSKEVDNAKKGLDQFGKGIHDNRLNVGNYSEALQGALGKFASLPGPIGKAAGASEGFISSLAKIGPYGALIAGGLLAISAPFVLFFKSTQEGMDLLKIKTAGWKAELDVLKGAIADVGKNAVESLEKTSKWSEFWSNVWLGIKTNLFGAVIATQMDIAKKAAEDYTRTLIALEEEEIAMIEPRAKATNQIKQARLEYSDTTKTFTERYEALKKAIDAENKMADDEIAHQIKVRDATKQDIDRLKTAGLNTTADTKRLAEANAKIYDLQSESAGRLIRTTRQMNTALKELHDEIIAVYESFTNTTSEIATGADELLKSQINKNKIYLERQLVDDKLTYEQREELKEKFFKASAILEDAIYQNEKDILESRYELEKSKAENVMAIGVNQEIIKQEKLKEIDIKYQNERDKLNTDHEITIAQRDLDDFNKKKKIIDDNNSAFVKQENALAKEKLQIKQELADSEMNIAASLSNFLKSAAGEDKALKDAALIADGVLAIAEVIIQTTKANTTIRAMAAASVLPGPLYFERLFIAFAKAQAPINLNRIAAGIDIATIIAAMAGNIKSNNQSSSSVSSSQGSSPTSITSVHNVAPQVGSTILTQSQLTQPQLNAMSSSSGLSADDIAKALAKMPAPVVTVEDIDARTKSSRRVSVRANI